MANDIPDVPEYAETPLRSHNRSDYSNVFEDYLISMPLVRAGLVSLANWMASLTSVVSAEMISQFLAAASANNDGILHINSHLMTQDITLPSGANASVTGPINTNGYKLKAGSDTRLVVL